jgi:two-component system, cell cycle sensor histidine kinase and response regulator CckA
MADTVRVLLVEDSEADAELVRLALRQGGLNACLTRVQAEADLRTALDLERWDVVLSDYSLPGFGGMAALEIVRKHDPDLPFVLVSGAIGEMTAVEMMKAGASDYVMKDYLGRLVPVMQREMLEAKHRRELRRVSQALRQANDSLTALINSSPLAIVAFDHERRVILWNPAAEQLFGWRAEEVVGRPVPFITDETRAEFMSVTERALAGESFTTRIARERRDGTPIDLSLSTAPLRNSSGDIYAVMSVLLDITDHLRADEALRASEAKFRAIFEHAGDAVFLLDTTGRLLDVNQKACTQLGYSHDEMVQMSLADFDTPEDAALVPERMQLLLEQGQATFEVVHVDRDGRHHDIEVNARILEHDGQLVVLSVERDISERKASDEALRHSEQRFRGILDNLQDAYFRTDAEGRFVLVSPSSVALYGYDSAEDMLSLPSDVMYADQEDRRTVLRKLAEFGWVHDEIGLALRKDGSTFWASLNAHVYHDEAGQVLGAEGIVRDISERKRAEAILRASEERFRGIYQASPIGIELYDDRGCLYDVNPACLRIFGVSSAEEVSGFHLFEDPNIPATAKETVRAGGIARYTVTFDFERVRRLGLYSTTRTGTVELEVVISSLQPSESGDTGGYLVLVQDVTGEKRMREEALRAQKLESLGLLAGGLAHDFNNILLVVLGNLQLARMFPRSDAKHNDLLLNAERGALDAQGLTQQLLTFSAGGSPVRKSADLRALAASAAKLCLSGSNAIGEVIAADDLWPAEVDPGQIGQVINNLLINAVQAMPGGGHITLTLDNVDLQQPDTLPLAPGKYVRVTIADEGTGIPPGHLPRIFEPYFTTKQKGSGLGLASAYSIVHAHGGHVAVSSTLGQGTTFTLHLPVAVGAPADTMEGVPELPTGSGRVLIMDDEEAICEFAKMLLEEVGYEVTTTFSGEAAIVAYQEALTAATPFNCVIVDLTVRGGMGGDEAMARILEIDPAARAIVASGYSTSSVMSRYREHGFRAVVVKPYQIPELLGTIKRVIEEL